MDVTVAPKELNSTLAPDSNFKMYFISSISCSIFVPWSSSIYFSMILVLSNSKSGADPLIVTFFHSNSLGAESEKLLTDWYNVLLGAVAYD